MLDGREGGVAQKLQLQLTCLALGPIEGLLFSCCEIDRNLGADDGSSVSDGSHEQY
jgi:hypothetical protein